MTDDAWDRVSTLFESVADAPANARAQLLADLDQEDPWVRDQLRSLLAAHDAADGRFDAPVIDELDDSQREALAPPDLLLTQRRVGAYEVLRKIGEGGMGSVYEAARADDTYRKRVAIKTIARGAESHVIASRFRRERQIMAELQHPNVAALIDGGVTDHGTPYFVMEYVDGVPIDRWCTTQRKTIGERIDLMLQVCRAVQHAHQRLVVHRDLKPQNVLVDGDGVVKLLDFGVARLTDPGHALDGVELTITRDGLSPMTVAYASPEQLRGEPVSTASDIYSLGVMLYELVAGVPPVGRAGRTAAQLTELVLNTETPPPSAVCTAEAAITCQLSDQKRLARLLSGDLDAIVLKAMHKDVTRRYHSVEALIADLERFVRGQPVSARPDTIWYRVRRFTTRHRRPVALVGVLLVVALASGIVTLRQWSAVQRERAQSARIADFLQGVLGAVDATSPGAVVPRIGPGASLSALLDTTVRRVPSEFPDDPAIRARLYLTVGSAMIAQGRLRQASDLLDSAMTLAASSPGDNSELLATASLEAGAASLHRNQLVRAESLVTRAITVLTDARRTDGELYARALKDRASLALVTGAYTALERDANAALALDGRRTAKPTMTKAIAINRLGTLQLVKGHALQADSMYRESLVMLGALGATHTSEMLDALFNAAMLARDLNKTAYADSLLVTLTDIAESTFGADSREAALMQIVRVGEAMKRGDTAVASTASARAVRIIDSIPEVLSMVRAITHFSPASIAIARHDWAAADSAVRRAVADLPDTPNSVQLLQLHTVHGFILTNLGQLDSAEAALQRAVVVYDAIGFNVPYARLTIHTEQARVYAFRGDTAGVTRELSAFQPDAAKAVRAYLAAEQARANPARPPRPPKVSRLPSPVSSLKKPSHPVTEQRSAMR